MPSNDRLTSRLVGGFAAGTIVLFVIVLLVALAVGAGLLIAFLVALFVGLIAGGSMGFLVAGKRFSDKP